MKDKEGVSFKQLIYWGIACPDNQNLSHVDDLNGTTSYNPLGFVAGSEDSYKTFAELFNPMISRYFDYPLDAVQPKN